MKRLVDSSGLLAPELVGCQFGSLTIVSRKADGRSDKLKVEVQCSLCGQAHMALYHNMRKRQDRASCAKCKGRKPVTVPRWLYQRCQAQQDRCRNPKSCNYKHYGARGIEFRFPSVNDAATWIAENLGIADKSFQIDRVDNSGHYEPGNLRWASRVTQMNNCRQSKGCRDRFLSFRKAHPEVRYSDRYLTEMLRLGFSDDWILKRYQVSKARNQFVRSGTYSMQGPYSASQQTDA